MTCETMDIATSPSRCAQPCADLTEAVVELRPLDGAGTARGGERGAGARLATRVPGAWPAEP